jgi:hypothetical protein
VVSFLRRQGGGRRLDLDIKNARIEIEVPADFNSETGRVAIRPRRFRVYPTTPESVTGAL